MRSFPYSSIFPILLTAFLLFSAPDIFAQCNTDGITIDAGTVPFFGDDLTTCGAGDNLNPENIISCGSQSYLEGEELIITFQVSESTLYHISLTNATDNYTSLKLFDGCPLQDQGGICVSTLENSNPDKILPVELQTGKTYYLIVSRWGDECFLFDLSIDLPATCPEPNEAGWQTISLPYSQQGLTTCGAGDNLNYANTIQCGSDGYLVGEEMVYIFEAPETQLYHINITGASDDYTSLKLYDGCPLISQESSCVAHSESNNADRVFPVDLVAGQTYYLVVTHWGEGCFNYNLSIDVPATCPQPGIDGWQAITLPFNQEGLTTCGAGDNLNYANTIQCGSDGYLVGEEMVYIFEAPETQLYHINITGASDDYTSLKLYDGCPLISQESSCVAHSESNNADRVFPVELVAGQTYYLVVTHWGEGCFNYNLSIDVPETCPQPGIDGWQSISLPFNQEGLTTCGAGDNLNYANVIECGSDSYLEGEEMVYIFEAPESQLYHINITGASDDYTSLKLYDGCPLISQESSCVAHSESNNADRVFPVELVAGQTYYLVVTHWGEGCFDYNLSIDVPATCPQSAMTGWDFVTLPYSQSGLTTCGMGDHLTYANMVQCGSDAYTTGEERIFVFEATQTALYSVSLQNSTSTYTSLKLFDGCPLISAGGACVVNSSSSAANRILEAELTQGGTYYLVVGNYYEECFEFSLEIDTQCLTPTPIIEQPDPVCEGSPMPELTVTNPEGTVSWYADSDLTQLLATGETYTPQIDTTTVFYVTNTLNCVSDVTEIIVEVIDAPEIAGDGFTEDGNMICEGLSFSLSVDVGESWLWNTGETTQSIDVIASESGVYSVETTLGSCTFTSEIFVTVLENIPPDPVTAMIPTDGALNVSLTPTLSWIPGENTTNFDLYLWTGSESSIPDEPIRDGLIAAQTQLTHFETAPATEFFWQVVSNNSECGFISGPVQSFHTRELPNLVVSNLAIETDGYSGQPFSLSFTVTNTGNATTGGQPWMDAVFLSLNNELDLTEDVLLGSYPNPVFLLPGESYTQELEITVPREYLGSFNFIIATNNNCNIEAVGGGGTNFEITCESLLDESNLNDNLLLTESTITFSLPPLPDIVPVTFGTPQLAFAGDTINVAYTATNDGQIPAQSSMITTTSNMCSQLGEIFDPPSNKAAYIIQEPLVFCSLDEPVWIDRIYLSTSPFHDPGQDILLSTEMIKMRSENYNDSLFTPLPEEFFLSLSERMSLIELWESIPDYLDVGKSYSKNIEVALPSCTEGDYYLHLVTEYADWIWEEDIENNVITQPIQILTTPPPDLIITGAELSEDPFSGQHVELNYNLKNDGAGNPAEGYWIDYIYLLDQPEIDPETDEPHKVISITRADSLDPGETAPVSTTLLIPEGYEGTYYLVVVSNAEGLVCEFDENNNTFVLPVNITLSPPPDLFISQIGITEPIRSESPVSIDYTLENVGNGPANGPWRERIFFSQNPDFTGSVNELIASRVIRDTLMGSETMEMNQTVNLPRVEPGTWYIFAHTNADTLLYEHGEINNNVARYGPFELLPRITSDLSISDVQIEQIADAGQVINYSFMVTNIGEGPTNSNRWSDLVYLSSSSQVGADTIPLVRRSNEEVLASGESYQKSGSLMIPNGLDGDFYFHFFADKNLLVENDVERANNLVSLPVEITQQPTPDLRLVSIDLPDFLYAGEEILVSYTVINEGDAAVTVPWKDQTGFSLTLESIQLGVRYKEQNRMLEAGESFTDEISIYPPFSLEGTYYLVISLDNRGEIYEHLAENNNIAAFAINVVQPQPADLFISNASVPLQAIPGRTNTWSFTVTNQGTHPSIGRFHNNIYLEGDSLPGLLPSLLLSTSVSSPYLRLEPDSSIVFNVEKPFPGVKDGLIETKIIANATQSVRENSIDIENNTFLVPETTESSMAILPLNELIADTLAMGSDLYYKLQLPDNADLRIKVNSNLNFAENAMFIRHNNVPDGPLYDQRHSGRNMASPGLLIPGTTEGDNYLKISNLNVSDIPTQNIEIRADILPYGIDSILPAVMGQGRVTSKIFGAGYRPGATIELLDSENTTVVTGQLLQFNSSMELKVRWQLDEVPIGVYNLRITNTNGESTMLPNGVTVEPAMEYEIVFNPLYNQIIGDRNPTTVGVVFSNISNVDIPYINASFHYLSEHELLGISAPDNLFTQSKLMALVTGQSQEEYDDFSLIPEKNEGDLPESVIPIYIKDLAPGEDISFSLTFKNFPYAVFTLGASYELLTTEQMMTFLTYNAMIIREYILSNPEFVDYLEFDLAQQNELISSLQNIDEYMLQVFETYAGYGLINSTDYLNFMFDCEDCDLPENYNVFVDPDSVDDMGLKTDKNLLPDPPSGCDSWGQAAASTYCEVISSQVFQCSVAATCLVGIPLAAVTIKLLVLSGVGIPVLAATVVPMVAYFMACKSNALGCLGSLIDIPIPSAEEAICMGVVKPCDPNEIHGPAGIGDEQFIAQSDVVNYTVLFENDPELATAPANQVRISVPISEFANPLSVRISSFGFADYVFDIPANIASVNQRIDLSEEEGYYLDVIGGLDITNNEVFWLFTTIDPLTGQIPFDPFGGFLKINDSTGVGEGFVNFSIMPHPDTETGDTLAHYADIFFDLNSPITTNTHFNTIDAVAPSTIVDELPKFSEEGTLRLSLSALDDEGGSGLSMVEVYMSKNDEAPVLVGKERKFEWLIDAQTCDSLAFFVRSIDKVGNAEPMPDQPQTHTIIGRNNVSAGDDVTLCAGNEVTLTASAGESWLWSNGETTQSITFVPDSTSVYSVIVTNSDGCPGEATVTVTLQDCTSVEENDQSGSLMKVYPNPVIAEEIRAEVLGLIAGNYLVRLLDQHGKILFNKQMEWNTTKSYLNLPTAGLAAGTYFLEVKGDNYHEVRTVILKR